MAPICDGAGVGKGRQLGACLLNHLLFHPKATRFLFVTASKQLASDFERDLKAIQWDLKKFPLRPIEEAVDQRLTMRRGIYFITYALLRAKSKAK